MMAVVDGQKWRRVGMRVGSWSWAGAAKVLSHDSGSLLDGKKCMLVSGFFS